MNQSNQIPIKISSKFLPLLKNESRYLILWGGAGSGKSVFAMQKLLLRATAGKHRFLLVRQFKKDIRASVYDGLKSLISSYGLNHRYKFNETRLDIVDTVNGSEFISVGLDDSEKLKSIFGITGIFIEEVTQIDEASFDQLDLRLRGQSEHYKQILAAFNPVDDSHWIKKKFSLPDIPSDIVTGPDLTAVHSTYKDNAFIDEDYKRILETSIRKNENRYRIYALGHWGKLQYGGEFYKEFRKSRHVSTVIYRPDLPIHVTFDFNVVPYVTACVWQIDGKHAKQIDEICLEPPRNTTRDVCREFCSRYRSHLGGVFVYGDPSGRARDTRSERGVNDFSIILSELKQFRPDLRVDKSAPAVKARGDFINEIFANDFDGINVIINESCKNTINDYSNLKEDSDGRKKKEKAKNKETGVSFELYGHTSDANDYFFCRAFSESYKRFLHGDQISKPFIGTRTKRGF